ncbi:hypothetical protein Nepgr_020512 [Nepenthes gracilis]|uniref:Uncharacterized protein n=1 Tax=Nepenthes gracilis TaxID=150966 RepID=A0AAD3SXF4_NEPGR|nr:hypothetical protein Nepgr_020512 [Nepenthes gracilis]
MVKLELFESSQCLDGNGPPQDVKNLLLAPNPQCQTITALAGVVNWSASDATIAQLKDEWDELVSEGLVLTSVDNYGAKALTMDINTMFNEVYDLAIDIFSFYGCSGKNGYSLAGSDKPSYESRPNPGDAAQLGVSHLEFTPPWSGFWNVMTNENPGSRDYRLDLCACKSNTEQVEGSGSGSYVAKYLSGSSGLEGGKSFFEPHLRIATSYYPTTHRIGSTSSYKGGP